MTNKEKINLYLDYVNNYLTLGKFALNNGLTFDQGVKVIAEGKELNEELAQKKKIKGNNLVTTVTNILNKRVTETEAKQFALDNYGILATHIRQNFIEKNRNNQ